ncbi:MAG: N-formylglutamate amidohydrolase [Azospirillum sp.]|nr:N-formylglutamate amidohydrolase [Azospirillum sp.]
MAAASGSSQTRQDFVEVVNPTGRGRFVLVCEHASNAIPASFRGLGLDPDLLGSHIAWDLGARDLALAMSALLDAPLIAPCISRLVYDCNRTAEAPGAVPETSEVYEIPGNQGLSDAQRAARRLRYYQPFHDAIAAVLDARAVAGTATALVTVHSFTPVFRGVRRMVELGVLYDADARLADALVPVIAADGTFDARRNQPYASVDGVTFTLVEHALPRGLANVMLEVRNDLIADPAASERVARKLSGALVEAYDRLGRAGAEEGHA